MKQKFHRGELAGSSDLTGRIKEMRENKWSPEVLREKLEQMEITHAEVKKRRPRIKANPASTKITIELSGWGLRKTVSRAEYEKEWQGKPGVKVIITF